MEREWHHWKENWSPTNETIILGLFLEFTKISYIRIYYSLKFAFIYKRLWQTVIQVHISDVFSSYISWRLNRWPMYSTVGLENILRIENILRGERSLTIGFCGIWLSMLCLLLKKWRTFVTLHQRVLWSIKSLKVDEHREEEHKNNCIFAEKQNVFLSGLSNWVLL